MFWSTLEHGLKVRIPRERWEDLAGPCNNLRGTERDFDAS